MVCGSLMAVANGLIPSLGAIIYGKLTDELVIRNSTNCTLNESVTTTTLRNLVAFEILQPRMKGANVTQTTAIDVTLNVTGIRVVIYGMDGKQLHERMFENVTAVRMNGTALNGTELVGFDIEGIYVEMEQLTEGNSVQGKKDEMKENKLRKNSSGWNSYVGNVKTKTVEIHTTDKDVAGSQHNKVRFNHPAEGLNKRLKERSFSGNFKENSSFESSRIQREKNSPQRLGTLFSNVSYDKLIISKFVSQDELFGSFVPSVTGRKDENKIETVEIPKKLSGINAIQLPRKREAQSNTSDGIQIGQAQSINSLIPPTPKPVILPPTNNVSYILRNITETCRSYENNVEGSMRKYALYYVFAAFATLIFAYGQMVFWNIASERGVRNLSENLTDSVMDKDPGYFDTKIHEGVLNIGDIT